MKRKKLMALFMTTVVTASMLAGCGGELPQQLTAMHQEVQKQAVKVQMVISQILRCSLQGRVLKLMRQRDSDDRSEDRSQS